MFDDLTSESSSVKTENAHEAQPRPTAEPRQTRAQDGRLLASAGARLRGADRDAGGMNTTEDVIGGCVLSGTHRPMTKVVYAGSTNIFVTPKVPVKVPVNG